MKYDAQAMTEYTVIRYHSHLLTPFELEVLDAFYIRQKAETSSNSEQERLIRERRGNLGDPRIDAMLERGYGEFSRNVTERVMQEHGDKIVLNRCPKCSRIVRTPKAKQCHWCYHNWH